MQDCAERASTFNQSVACGDTIEIYLRDFSTNEGYFAPDGRAVS